MSADSADFRLMGPVTKTIPPVAVFPGRTAKVVEERTPVV